MDVLDRYMFILKPFWVPGSGLKGLGCLESGYGA